jgi:hypothetical protein
MTNSNNISFDSDCPVTIDDNGENYITLSNGQQASAGRTLKTLGNLTQKSNEPIINAIMRQAERNGLMESVGFPKEVRGRVSEVQQLGWQLNIDFAR